MESPKKLGIKPPYDPAIPFLGIYPEETETERDTCTPVLIAALFIIAMTWKQPRCPSADKWIRKLWYLEKEIATHSRILAWRIPWTEEPGRLQSMGSQEWDT